MKIGSLKTIRWSVVFKASILLIIGAIIGMICTAIIFIVKLSKMGIEITLF